MKFCLGFQNTVLADSWNNWYGYNLRLPSPHPTQVLFWSRKGLRTISPANAEKQQK